MDQELYSRSMPWISISDLLAAWDSGISAVNKSVHDVNSDFGWTVDDLAGLLFLRTAIDIELPDVMQIELLQLDERYKATTTVDERGRGVSIIDDTLPRDPWWWQRLPARGMLREEFEVIWQHRAELDEEIAELNVNYRWGP